MVRRDCGQQFLFGRFYRHSRFVELQFSTLGDLDRINAGIGSNALARDKSLLLQSFENAGQCRPVDAARGDQSGLARAFVFLDGREHKVLR